MKRGGRYAAVVLIAWAFSATPALLAAGVISNNLESLLAKVRTEDVSVNNLKLMYDARTNAPNAEIREIVLKACGAGLLYLGQQDAYNKKIRSAISEVEKFEKSFLVPCDKCNGSGKKEEICSKCRGTGRCSNPMCRGGVSVVTGFDGRAWARPCPVCKGTGRCLECNGSGKVLVTCPSCRGVGGLFSKSMALAVYKEGVETAVGLLNSLRAAEAEKAAKAEFEAKMRETQLATTREAMVAGAKAAAEEKARLEAKAAAEAAEKARKESEERRLAEKDIVYAKSVVIIEGDKSVGTGFLCKFKGRKVVLSNAHVLVGNREWRLVTRDGEEIDYGKILISRDRDIIAYELASEVSSPFLNVCENISDLKNEEPVVVFGNSSGQRVVTTIRGKVQGVGPDIVEVDAAFVHGNSGSPIIAYGTDEVIGIATYVSRNPQINWVERNTRFAEVRRFGMRLDNTAWSSFTTFDRTVYDQALAVFDEIVRFVTVDIMKGQWQGPYYRPSFQTRMTIESLLEKYRATPEWFRRYAEEASLCANVCERILAMEQ